MQGVPGSSPGASTKFFPINSDTSRPPDSLTGSDSNLSRANLRANRNPREPLTTRLSLRLIFSRAVGSSPSAAQGFLTNQGLRGPCVPTGRCEVIYIFCLHVRIKSLPYWQTPVRLHRLNSAALWPSIFGPEWRNGRRAGRRTHSTARNLVLSSTLMTNIPCIFSSGALSPGTVLLTLGHKNYPSSIRVAPRP
jgi:hypothetical protein